MDIISILNKRAEYSDHYLCVHWIEDLIESDEEEVAVALTSGFFINKAISDKYFGMLLDRYNLKAVFDMKNPYETTSLSFFLYVFTKNSVNKIMYGIYKEMLKYRCPQRDGLVLPKKYPGDYIRYINNVESYVSTGVCPVSDDTCEFGEFLPGDFDKRRWNPAYYSEAMVNAFKYIEDNETVSLGHIAEIIKPIPSKEKTKFYLTVENWKYPIDYNNLSEGYKSNCTLHKGDIIYLNKDRIFLVYDEPEVELYTMRDAYIIRPKKEGFCSEYLFLYLQTEAIQTLLGAEETGVIPRIRSKSVFENLPVTIPDKDSNHYRYVFYSERFPISFLSKLPASIVNAAGENSNSSSDKPMVFISYSSKDKNIADNLCSKLESRGMRVWYAPRDVVGPYAESIYDAIYRSSYFVIILSENSMKSQHVLNEIELAFQRLPQNIKFKPLRIDDTMFTASMNYYLSRQHWLDAIDPPIEDRLNEFVDSILEDK